MSDVGLIGLGNAGGPLGRRLLAKGHRLKVYDLSGDAMNARPAGSSCSSRAWPFYDTVCLRDLRRPDGRARAVRIVVAGSSDGHTGNVR